MDLIRLLLILFVSHGSYHSTDSVPISTHYPEIGVEHIVGIPCCYLPEKDNDVNRDMVFSIQDHKDCGTFKKPPNNWRVFQGRNAYPGQFPWFVFIFTAETQQDFLLGLYNHCGGVILDEFNILTAAHCMKSKIGTELLIAFGVQNIQFYNIDTVFENSIPIVLKEWHNVFFPPTYRFMGEPWHFADVAIIKLKGTPITMDIENDVNSICWRSLINYHFNPCQSVTVAGFGVTWMNKTLTNTTYLVSPQVLQTSKQRKCIHVHCVRHSPPWFTSYILDEFCTARRDRPRSLICAGDSGSPVITYVNQQLNLTGIANERGVLVGIARGGVQNCGETVDSNGFLVTGRHTSVMYHMRWIEGVVDNDPHYVSQTEGVVAQSLFYPHP